MPLQPANFMINNGIMFRGKFGGLRRFITSRLFRPGRWLRVVGVVAGCLTILYLSFGGRFWHPARVPKHTKQTGKVKPWKPSTAGDDLFTNLVVAKIKIEISASDIRHLGLSTLHRAWSFIPRPEALCTVREGDRVYTNVAIHLKGSAGSFNPISANPALTLHFDKYVADQTFHGLKKISLNNSVQDRTFMSEKICRELYDRAGIPVPRAGFATLELNGRDLGPRVLLEGYNRQFLKRYFADCSGNLYNGDDITDIHPDMEVNSGDDPTNKSDLKRLLAATSQPVNKRFAELEKVLDMDRFLKVVAMDVILCNWDGYTLNRNNYRVYHDAPNDKMIFMPHGMDQMFDSRRVREIIPPLRGRVTQAVLSTPEGNQRYRETFSFLATNIYDAPRITARVAELQQVIRPVLLERSMRRARNHDQIVARLTSRILERDQKLQQQLNLQPSPRKDANSAMRLKSKSAQ